MPSALSALHAYMAAIAQAAASEGPGSQPTDAQIHHSEFGPRRPPDAGGVSRMTGSSDAHGYGVRKALG